MPACFIITHIIAALAAALLVTGIITVIRGFVFKLDKMLTRGTYYVAVAVFLLAGVHMMGKFHHMSKCGDGPCKTEMRCGDKADGKCDMKGPGNPHMFMKCFKGGEGDEMDMFKNMMMMMMCGDKGCDMQNCDMKCDTSKCKGEVKKEVIIKKTK